MKSVSIRWSRCSFGVFQRTTQRKQTPHKSKQNKKKTNKIAREKKNQRIAIHHQPQNIEYYYAISILYNSFVRVFTCIRPPVRCWYRGFTYDILFHFWLLLAVFICMVSARAIAFSYLPQSLSLFFSGCVCASKSYTCFSWARRNTQKKKW